MKSLNALLLGLSFSLLTGCSLMGISTTEEASYQILAQDGQFEIRRYDPQLLAQTRIEAGYDRSEYIGFRRLAGYIFGDNRKQSKIDMTVPVYQEQHGESEKIAMTVPVYQEASQEPKGESETSEDAGWVMSFVMPKGYDMENIPMPENNKVELVTLPEKTVAAVRYSGFYGEKKIQQKADRLKAWLTEQGYRPVSKARSATYNPPWTLPFLRRNEVHVDVEPI